MITDSISSFTQGTYLQPPRLNLWAHFSYSHTGKCHPIVSQPPLAGKLKVAELGNPAVVGKSCQSQRKHLTSPTAGLHRTLRGRRTAGKSRTWCQAPERLQQTALAQPSGAVSAQNARHQARHFLVTHPALQTSCTARSKPNSHTWVSHKA